MRLNRFRVIGILKTVVCIAIALLVVSCIPNASDDELEPPFDDTITDSTIIVIDSTFTASAEYMQKEWMAEYIGFDSMQSQSQNQNVISAIHRLVYFSPDSFYESHVQGIVNIEDTTITIYKEFEHEYGTYSFDVEKQQMTYHVEYDSLLNFNTDKLERYAGKFIPEIGIRKEYNENIRFSYEKEGKRDWIRVDDNLRSIDDHSVQLIYIMKNQ